MKRLQLAALMLAWAFAAQAWALGGLAGLTVYDRSDGRRLPVHWHEGRAWIEGRPGNEYRIELRSRRGEPLLAVVSVDGVNVVTGETADPGQSGYVLAPRARLAVDGWRKSLAQVAAFYFTPLPDSYAARTGRPDDVGVIGVALFRRMAAPPPAPVAPLSKSEGDRRARAAPAEAASGAGSAGPAEDRAAEETAGRLGTGHGRRETSHARYVEFERASAAPAETIVLHYDSRANLVARGVLRAPRCASGCGAHPRPFPGGFVPDPQACLPRPAPFAPGC